MCRLLNGALLNTTEQEILPDFLNIQSPAHWSVAPSLGWHSYPYIPLYCSLKDYGKISIKRSYSCIIIRSYRKESPTYQILKAHRGSGTTFWSEKNTLRTILRHETKLLSTPQTTSSYFPKGFIYLRLILLPPTTNMIKQKHETWLWNFKCKYNFATLSFMFSKLYLFKHCQFKKLMALWIDINISI